MKETVSDATFFSFFGLVLGTILLIFAMRYLAGYQQARAAVARDQAYAELARTSSADQAATSAALAGIHTALADATSRLAAIERLLKEVE